MSGVDGLPGTPAHQAILQGVIAHLGDDPRIVAVCLFGSLSLGRWDEYSDCDLDVTVADGVRIEVAAELQGLAAALGEPHALILHDRGEDEGDIVLSTLLSLSLRFHALAETSPNVVPGLRLLTGRVDRAVIVEAGAARGSRATRPNRDPVIACLRALLAADVALQRRRRWQALHMLEQARADLLEIVLRPRGVHRVYRGADAHASDRWVECLGATVPSFDLADMQRALARLLDLVAEDLPAMSGGGPALTPAQGAVVQRLRERLAAQRLAGADGDP